MNRQSEAETLLLIMFPVWGDVPQRSVNVKVTSPNAAVPTQVPDCRNKAC